MNSPTSSAQNWCQSKNSELANKIKELESVGFKLEMFRLLIALLTISGPFLAGSLPTNLQILGYATLPVGIWIFLILVRKHQIISDEIYFCKNTLEAIKQSLQLLQEPQKPIGNFKRPGSIIRPNQNHWPLSLQETDDIDMYSEGASIFGRINRAITDKGKNYLAGLLESPLLDQNDIKNRVAAYQELQNQIDSLHLLAGNAIAFDELKDQFEKLKEALASKSQIQQTIWPKFIQIYFPCFFIAAALAISNLIPLPILALLLIINFVIAKQIANAISSSILPWLSISSLLNYAEMYLQQADKLQVTNPHLTHLQNKTKKLLQTGDLASLKSITGKLRLRYSGVIHLIIDNLVFWDIRYAVKLEKLLQKENNLNELEDVIGEWEAHIAMALQNFINENGAYAEITNNLEIKITNGRHPLIDPNKAVPNDINLKSDDRAWVISGSNMSGKSTFLRMVGTNILFSQIGLKTYAQSVTCCPIRLMTDLRIRDNLYKNESYFLAEVRQLKRMIDFSKEKPALLGLIDEPYRGTNSEERIAASVEVLRNLLESGGFFLTATHDREVTEMAEKMPAVTNHHFKEELSETDIAFDYKIRKGATTTRNAIRVLQKEGYPESVIANAEAYLQTKNKNTRAF